jgi:hypothetical protein
MLFGARIDPDRRRRLTTANAAELIGPSPKCSHTKVQCCKPMGVKVRRLFTVATDLQTSRMRLVELQEILRQNDIKLAEAQKAQAELLRKQRELDDEKREMELTIEKRVQAT